MCFFAVSEILHEKKREAKQLSEEINNTKHEIDELKQKLDVISENREFQPETITTGEVVMDEEEFELVRCLKTAKNEYRDNYELLQKLRADIAYCENLVKQCRQKLLAEFNVWFAESFPSKETKDELAESIKGSGGSPVKVAFQPREDEGERFERIQKHALMRDPESLAFYNARIQTERRKLYCGTTQERRPGSVTSSIRNAPPKSMIIH